VAIAHLIHGYLGAGKTTFARRLEASLPGIRFTHDEWMARLYGDDPPVENFQRFYQRVSEQIDSVWPRCLELGVDVVLDLGFWSRRQRDDVRARIAAMGATSRLYLLSCPDALAWQRIEKRNAGLNGSLYISRNTFEELKSRFEPLDADEDHCAIESCAIRFIS
jgi:predicted kinase